MSNALTAAGMTNCHADGDAMAVVRFVDSDGHGWLEASGRVQFEDIEFVRDAETGVLTVRPRRMVVCDDTGRVDEAAVPVVSLGTGRLAT